MGFLELTLNYYSTPTILEFLRVEFFGGFFAVWVGCDLRYDDTNCDPDKSVPISDTNVITRD